MTSAASVLAAPVRSSASGKLKLVLVTLAIVAAAELIGPVQFSVDPGKVALLPMLWAPVGLRYHALHHLLPGVPYHGLAEAHRRLVKTLDADSPYHKGNYPGLPGLVGKIVRSTMIDRR